MTTKPDAPTTTAPAGTPASPASAPAAGRARDVPKTMRDARLARETKRRAAAAKPLENPLREGLRLERVPDPSVFVLFGATGDLANRKVFPALFQLWRTHLLPHEFRIIAVGRRPYTDEAFREELRASMATHARVQPIDEDAWAELASRIVYHRGDFNDAALYSSLAERLDALDRDEGTRGNRVYYLATQPSAVAIR